MKKVWLMEVEDCDVTFNTEHECVYLKNEDAGYNFELSTDDLEGITATEEDQFWPSKGFVLRITGDDARDILQEYKNAKYSDQSDWEVEIQCSCDVFMEELKIHVSNMAKDTLTGICCVEDFVRDYGKKMNELAVEISKDRRGDQ